MLWGLLGQLFGIGWSGPLYFTFHYISSQMDNYKALDQRTTNLANTRTILPAMLAAFHVPFFASMAPWKTPEQRLWWTWIWQPFPVWVSLIQRVARGLQISKNTVYYDRMHAPNRDLPVLRRTIYTFSALSAATWLYTLSRSSPLSVLKSFIPLWTPPPSSAGIWAIARNFIQWDHVLGFSSAYVWLGLLFRDLKKWGKTDASWAKIVGSAALSTVALGPGATVGLGWLWREELLASKKTKGALLEGTWEERQRERADKLRLGNGAVSEKV
jgi:hypothetical protein